MRELPGARLLVKLTWEVDLKWLVMRPWCWKILTVMLLQTSLTRLGRPKSTKIDFLDSTRMYKFTGGAYYASLDLLVIWRGRNPSPWCIDLYMYGIAVLASQRYLHLPIWLMIATWFTATGPVLDCHHQWSNWRFHRPKWRLATDLLPLTDHVCGTVYPRPFATHHCHSLTSLIAHLLGQWL